MKSGINTYINVNFIHKLWTHFCVSGYLYAFLFSIISLNFIYFYSDRENFASVYLSAGIWFAYAVFTFILIRIYRLRGISEQKQIEEKLLTEKNFTNAVLDNAGALLVVLDNTGRICRFNRAAEKISGYTFKEIEGTYPWDTLLPPENAEIIRTNAFEALANNPESMVGNYTNEWVSKDGSRHLIEWVNTVLLDKNGKMEFMVSLGNDITKRKEAEKHIQEQSRLLDMIFQYSLDSLVILDKDYNFVRVTETYARECQRDSSSFPGLNHFELYPSNLEEELEEYRREKKIYNKSERPFIFPDHPEWGTTYWDLAMVPILDSTGEIELFVFTLKNVTEKKIIQLNLEKSVQEKEILLKEIHHRVKNNLQVISSLLYLQSNKINDPAHIELFRESQNRVSAMALIHEQLYQSNNFAEVDFGEYTHTLIGHLFQTYGIDGTRVRYSIETGSILLDINLAVTCGLILNEIVSNSLKYAFPKSSSGEIQISMKNEPEEDLTLIISDNGIGFPEDFDEDTINSLGLKLIKRMVEQIQGESTRKTSKNGTTHTITIKK